MSNMEAFKDIAVGETTYRIGKMTAKHGSWIVAQLMTKMLPSAVERGLGIASLPENRSQLSEDEFYSIQDKCLAVCSRHEVSSGGTPVIMPIMAAPGVFAIKELECDTLTILTLTIHSLLFNVACFFDGDALTSILESFKGLSLFKPSM